VVRQHFFKYITLHINIQLFTQVICIFKILDQSLVKNQYFFLLLYAASAILIRL